MEANVNSEAARFELDPTQGARLLDRLTWFAEGHHWGPALGAVLIGVAGAWLAHMAGGRGRERSHDLKLREAIEAMPEGLAFYDSEDRIVVWNRRYAELNYEGGGQLKSGVAFRELLEVGLRAGVYPEAAGREAEWLEARLTQRHTGAAVWSRKTAAIGCGSWNGARLTAAWSPSARILRI
jgi:hypothetical protein